ncbi:HNH endonuclease [Cupriavidus gilardii]|uniref:HNH endonuclease n=1 Tax=Cupriavidus gilardii TaxID=82541 RepID=A0ABY4VNY9_9BURK|nr:HNH endonuclease [Cupriavidus gilardii]USE78954.1 HNH endonuclease [Cupriavidus gilardii]
MINLPKHVRRVGNRYVLHHPDGRKINIGSSIREARGNYAAALGSTRFLPERDLWPNIDRSSGSEGCWPWLGAVDKDGYGYVGRLRAHRIAYALSAGIGLSPGQVVMHFCDNPICCNPRHLALGTQKANVADRVAKGRSAAGERNGRSKLSVDDVIEIRSCGGSLATVAERYGVDKSTVRDIRRMRTWVGV